MLNHHDLLTDTEKRIFCINVEVSSENMSFLMDVGYLFLNNIQTDRLVVDSDSGSRYELAIPEECQNIEGSQFNVRLQVLRILV